MLNVARVGTTNTGESSQALEQEAPSVVSSIAQAALVQQEEQPTTVLTAQVTVSNQEALQQKKNQLVQILSTLLKKENGYQYKDVINNIIDIINNLYDYDPEKIKYAFADYLKSHDNLVDLYQFILKQDLGDLQNPLSVAFRLALICKEGDKARSYIQDKLSVNDLKYLVNLGEYDQVLAIIDKGDWLLMETETEFRDLAVSIIEDTKVIANDKLLLLIARSYAKEGNLKSAIQYVKKVLDGNWHLYSSHRHTIYLIAQEFFKNNKLSPEERISFRSDFIAAILPTPDSLSIPSPIRNMDRIVSSSVSALERMPPELHANILSFADIKTLDRLAQTDVTEARIIYDIEKKHLCKLLTLIINELSESNTAIVLELNDIKNKLENIPACNLDDVKYMVVKYLSEMSPFGLKTLKEKIKHEDLGRFENIIELALLTAKRSSLFEKVTVGYSIADLQFLLSEGSCDKHRMLIYLSENNLILKATAFRNFAVRLLESFNIKEKQRFLDISFGIILTIAESYANEGNFTLALQATKEIIMSGYRYNHCSTKIHLIKKIFDEKGLTFDDGKPDGFAFLAALLPTPKLSAIRSSSQVDQGSSFSDSKALDSLSQESVQEAKRVYEAEKEGILNLLNAFCAFLQKKPTKYKTVFYEINDLLVKVTNSDCDFDDVKHIAIKYLVAVFAEDLILLKEINDQFDCGRFKNIIGIILLIHSLFIPLELSDDDSKFLQKEFDFSSSKLDLVRVNGQNGNGR